MKVIEKEKKQKDLFIPFTSKILPLTEKILYKRIEEEYLIDRNDEYQAILQVRTADLRGMNRADLNRAIECLTIINRIYAEPLKILSMTYLTKTSEQQKFWKRKVEQHRLEVFESSGHRQLQARRKYQYALDNLRRMVWVEENLNELVFFFVVYGKTRKDIEGNLRSIKQMGGRTLELSQITDESELERIVFKLNNMNTAI